MRHREGGSRGREGGSRESKGGREEGGEGEEGRDEGRGKERCRPGPARGHSSSVSGPQAEPGVLAAFPKRRRFAAALIPGLFRNSIQSHHKGGSSMQTHPAVSVGFELASSSILPTRTRHPQDGIQNARGSGTGRPLPREHSSFGNNCASWL